MVFNKIVKIHTLAFKLVKRNSTGVVLIVSALNNLPPAIQSFYLFSGKNHCVSKSVNMNVCGSIKGGFFEESATGSLAS